VEPFRNSSGSETKIHYSGAAFRLPALVWWGPASARPASGGAARGAGEAGPEPGQVRAAGRTYTGTYTKIPSGYMGQLVDWPDVVTEGKTLEECREMLADALREMIAAYRQQQKELPASGALLEQIPVEV
jgi:predicted RNase H-like HicB family nuclease